MADAILVWCYHCASHRPAGDFKPGHKRCYPCLKALARERYANNAEYRERIRAQSRAWADANKERKRAMDKAYAMANKERIAAYKRAYKLANWERVTQTQNRCRQQSPEKYREREAAYRERNRQACNERISEWKARNPHKTVAYESKRRAAELRAIPAWADLDAISEIYERARAMGKDYHVDHAVPLIGKTVCGLHCEANLEIVPAAVNLKKNNRRWPDMWE